jgi:pyruvate/2-oxoglutarate dehydrogenase complex dihydrolipoamide dehydrogenase (E3) component
MSEQVDVIVMGLGVAGEHVADTLAAEGLQVVGIENRLVGGECPYYGCIPSKMVVRGADLVAEGERVNGHAGTAEVQPDYTPVAIRIRDEATADWNDDVAVERLEKVGGRFVRGTARFIGTRQVEAAGRTFEARRAVVIATGSSPAVPPVPGLDQVDYWTNQDALRAREMPRSIIVMGGGAVGLELAQAYARFGVRVCLVEGLAHVLALEEPEASQELERILTDEGLEIHHGVRATSVEGGPDGVTVVLEDGGRVSAERVLVATGRRNNLSDLNLEAVGLDPKAHSIEVDGRLHAGDGIYAIGDITAKGAFTHVAFYQARIVVDDILGRPTRDADYRALPRVTFTDPEVGATGLTEKQARERGLNVRTGLSAIGASTRGWIHGPGSAGFIKLVEDADRGVLVGATAMGPWGGEVMSMLALAVQESVPTENLRHMIFAYPTFHRGIEGALEDLASKVTAG